MSEKSSVSPVLRLTETALMLALATVLSIFKLFDLPYGGSITLASLLPVVIVAFRHGTRWGLVTALLYGACQALLGAENFGYVPGATAFVCILLFDYLLAFIGGAAGGLFAKLKNPSLALALGALVACVWRYLCHVVSGCTVWASTPFFTDGAAVAFSLAYNASYMLPETVVTVAAAYWLGGVLDFRKPRLGPTLRETAAPRRVLAVLGRLLVIGAVAYELVELTVAGMLALSAADFSAASFSLAAVILPWERMLAVGGICGVLAAAFLLLSRRTAKTA